MTFSNALFRRRRIFLRLGVALSIVAPVGRSIVGSSAPVHSPVLQPVGDGFVAVGGWVLPAHHLRG